MIKFFQEIINIFDEGIKFLFPLIERVKKYEKTHERFENLYDFLHNFYTIYMKIVTMHASYPNRLEKLIAVSPYNLILLYLALFLFLYLLVF